MRVSGEPYSVTEYIGELNTKLATIYGDVIGEVSEMKIAASGHAYFTLKDKGSGEILPCTIWRMKYQLSSVNIEIGMELLVRGKPNYYGPFGKLSFIADSVELVGEGALLKAYDKLKAKLDAEGVFSDARKRPIPAYPHRIGVVTSVHGEVIHDFSKNLGKYGFDVKILDTRVEGAESGKELTLSVRSMRKENIDVLVILRGGGSVQSLAGFDNEALVREIVSFPVPVIAGVGHHRDVPLAAMAADAAESTPSLVAELLNESWSAAQYSLERSERTVLQGYTASLRTSHLNIDAAYRQIERALTNIFATYAEAERSVRAGLSKISFALGRAEESIAEDARTITSRFARKISETRTEHLIHTPVRISTLYDSMVRACGERINTAARLIDLNDPQRQLQLGYSLVFSNGTIVRSGSDLTTGSLVEMRFAEGSAEAEIKDILK